MSHNLFWMSCVDAVAVQGYVEASLDENERAAVEAHLDTCSDCRRLVAALADGADTVDDSPKARRDKKHVMIDRFNVMRRLGEGGMGVVYMAHDPQLKRDVAVKLLHPDEARGEEMQARLLREAQAMAQVAHPNVIAVYDVGTWDGEVFLAMELATGGTLRAWCAKQRTPSEIVDAFAAAGRGLAAAHAAGLVHRDFKSDNVLVGADGRMRVTDFGLARSHGAVDKPSARPSRPLASFTATGMVMGTPGYIAPELYAGDPADARTDQFAFCVALWEALFGSRPFAGTNEDEVAIAVAEGRITDPAQRRGVRRAIEAALRRGLAAGPEERWASMDELIAELSKRRSRAWIVAAAAVVLLAAGGVAFAKWPRPIVAAVPADARVDALDVATTRAMHEIEAIEKRGLAHEQAHELVDAKADLADAVARARQIRMPSLLIDTLIEQADVLFVIGDLAAAETSLREARRVAETSDDVARRSKASIALAGILDREGKSEEAEDVRSLGIAAGTRKQADDASRADALESEADTQRDLDQSRKSWDAALVLRDKLGDLEAHALNRIGLANTYVKAELNERAHEVMVACLAYVEARHTDEAKRALVTTLKMFQLVDLAQNRWADAAAHARRAIELQQTGHGRATADDYANLGHALLALHDRKGADAAWAKALDLQSDQPLQRADTLGMIAVAEHLQADDASAALHAGAAVDLLIATAGPHNPATLQMEMMQVKVLLGDHQFAKALPIAERLLPEIESQFKTDSALIGDIRFAIARAVVDHDKPRAHTLAASARSEYQKLGAGGTKRIELVERWEKDPAHFDPLK